MKRVSLITLLMSSVLPVFSCGRTPTPSPPVKPLVLHPVFQTQITGKSSSRPAIQVDILNEGEGPFGDAELYLAVQSSRFPASAWVLLPINVGDFQGCRSRFVQLPFEVSPGDNLVFNLLDDDELTEEEEGLITTSCRAVGYIVWIAGSAYSPPLARLVAPVTADMSDILGEATVSGMSMSKFDNFGHGVYIVPEVMPRQPNEANQFHVLDDSNYARINLRIYAPPTALDGFASNLPFSNAGEVPQRAMVQKL